MDENVSTRTGIEFSFAKCNVTVFFHSAYFLAVIAYTLHNDHFPYNLPDLYSLSMQALDMIRGKNILLLMDSHLEGNFSTDEATVVFDLASQCLQYEPRDRPKIKDLVTTLSKLQNKPDVSLMIFF